MTVKKFITSIFLFPLVSLFLHSSTHLQNLNLDPSDVIPKLTKAESILFGIWDPDEIPFLSQVPVFVHPMQEQMASTAMVIVDGASYSQIYKSTMKEIAVKKRMMNDAMNPLPYAQEDIRE